MHRRKSLGLLLGASTFLFIIYLKTASISITNLKYHPLLLKVDRLKSIRPYYPPPTKTAVDVKNAKIPVVEKTKSVDSIKPKIADVAVQTEIAKRLHFVFKDDKVPTMYSSAVKSWLKYHPDWETWFWSDHDARLFIQDKFPGFLRLYDSYEHGLQRSDVIRYFILYHYGGVYADMDVRALRPVHDLLKDRTCVISKEPPLQTQIIFNEANTLTNSMMACVRGHPFMKHLLYSLEEASKRSKEPAGILLSTGPFFLNHTHNTYVQSYPTCSMTSSPTNNQSEDAAKLRKFELSQSESSVCRMAIVDYKFMCPKMDMPMIRLRKKFCAGGKDKGFYQKKACDELVKTRFATPPFPKEAFAEHLWYHFGWSSEKDKRRRRMIDIGKLLKKPRRYTVDTV